MQPLTTIESQVDAGLVDAIATIVRVRTPRPNIYRIASGFHNFEPRSARDALLTVARELEQAHNLEPQRP
jgi:hypothetical protein